MRPENSHNLVNLKTSVYYSPRPSSRLWPAFVWIGLCAIGLALVIAWVISKY